MLDFHTNTPEPVETVMPRSRREEQRRRNAVARRKLEALRERKLLKMQLTDVWDETTDVQRHTRQGSLPVPPLKP